MHRLAGFLRRVVLALFATTATAQDKLAVEIGYMPILPVSQLFVGLDDGSIKAAGIDAKLVQFQEGPAMVQALLAGQLDVAYFGIGPAMVARGRGADIKVVASNIVEQISLVALGELAAYFDGDPATAFARFTADKGRRPVISTFPVGSVPQTVLQYWLRKQLAIDPAQIDVIYQGAAQVQQALLTEAVDGAAILEPAVSIVLSRLPKARVVASGSQMFPNQPGAVLVVREGLIASNPDMVQALVAAHAKATQILHDTPDAAVVAVGKYVGGGRLAPEIIKAALESSKDGFVADPGAIIETTRVMRDFQLELGTLTKSVDIDALFDTRFYDALPSKAIKPK